MQYFEGGTAVITGAANGIGLSLTRQAVQEGMKIVLSDGSTRRSAPARLLP